MPSPTRPAGPSSAGLPRVRPPCPELAGPFPISPQAVSKHLKVLERAGLITRGRTAQLRPSRLQAVPLQDAVDWLERYRRFWEDGFDRLEARLRAPEDGPTGA